MPNKNHIRKHGFNVITYSFWYYRYSMVIQESVVFETTKSQNIEMFRALEIRTRNTKGGPFLLLLTTSLNLTITKTQTQNIGISWGHQFATMPQSIYCLLYQISNIWY